jgi:ribosomal protein S18 acetylase RimI-like enzyme
MIKVVELHKKQVVDILTKSFDNNKNVNYVVKQDRKRIERILSLMEYTFDYYVNSGEIYLTDDQAGAMVLVFPGKSPGIATSMRLNLRLIVKSIGLARVIKVLNWKSRTGKYLPKSPCIYIDFVGVSPNRQRGGLGSKLIKKAIERSQETKLPIYLITSMPENLPFYSLFDFEVYKEIIINHKIISYEGWL